MNDKIFEELFNKGRAIFGDIGGSPQGIVQNIHTVTDAELQQCYAAVHRAIEVRKAAFNKFEDAAIAWTYEVHNAVAKGLLQ